LAPESASAAKAAIVSQVGQFYVGDRVSFTSALTPTFFAAAKKVGAAPHRGNANKPTRSRDPANDQPLPQDRIT
ncbi:hypothetical protein QCE73_20555, partial [Caballeronia sp. LZ029]|uniref:hypothetical protein n=1 Tax=Caballeronia sp. LZ029 TaxID=3038564 RepID=UPI002857630D